MNLFYAIFFGILGIIVIARIASKAMPRETQFGDGAPQADHKRKENNSDQSKLLLYLESLVSLLVKRGVITEDELLEEISRKEKHKGVD